MDAGSFFDSSFIAGSSKPPSSALIAAFPELEFDTFVTLGGFTQEESEDFLVSENVCNEIEQCTVPGSSPAFAIAWTPDLGFTGPSAGGNYPIARIILSPDANGSLYYFGSTGDGAPPLLKRGIIRNSILVGIPELVPEPTTLTLFGLAVIGIAARRRRTRVAATVGQS